MIVVAQRETDEIPSVGVERAAMQEDDRRQMLVAPVQIVEPHLAKLEFMALGKHHPVEAETRADRRGFEMLAVFLGRQAHGETGSSKRLGHASCPARVAG